MQYTAKDKTVLAELYTSVITAISKYYKYLEITGVPAEESYLTHWLEQWDMHDQYEDIDCFLQE